MNPSIMVQASEGESVDSPTVNITVKIAKCFGCCVPRKLILAKIAKIKRMRRRKWYKRHNIENFNEQDPKEWTDYDFHVPTKESEQEADHIKFDKYSMILKMCEKI